MKVPHTAVILVIVSCTTPLIAGEPEVKQQRSVNDLMTAVITPATDTIWGIENPTSQAEWQVYIDAAVQVIDASRQIKSGGSGPNDAAWARDPQWQQIADALIESAREVREAATEHDLDTLIEVANYKMYPPCEECHIMFHPAFQEKESN